MPLPERLISDQLLRRIIIAGVILVLGACLLSQAMMQLGGGPRDEPMDLSEQFPDSFGEDAENAVVFPDGMPPFISCGGVFYPEKMVFDVGLAIGGLLFGLLAIEVFLRTESALVATNGSPIRRIANLGQLVAGFVVAVSMIMITQHPFNTSLVKHLFYAMNIFHGSYFWGGFLAISRSNLDAGLTTVRDLSIKQSRWALVVAGFISFQLMTAFIAGGYLVTSAIFEWFITFAAEFQTLTILPILALAHPSQEE